MIACAPFPAPCGGINVSGHWWVRFSVSLEHPLSRQSLLRLAEVVNQMCVRDRVPALFYPVAQEPPLANCLSWAFEAKNDTFWPAALAASLRELLPRAADEWGVIAIAPLSAGTRPPGRNPACANSAGWPILPGVSLAEP